MTRLLCIFFPCRWFHIKDSIWQCERCKTISKDRVDNGSGGWHKGCPQ